LIRQKRRRAADDGPSVGPSIPASPRAFEYSFDGLVTMGADGRITRSNDAACRILGQPLEKIVGKRVQDIVRVRRRSVAKSVFAIPPHGEGKQLALTLKRPNNSIVDVLVRECPGDSPRERVWILRELTRDGSISDALERQSRLLMEAQRVGRTGAWELDVNTGLLIWTLELRRMMEVPDTTETMAIEDSFKYYSAASELIVREAFHSTVTRGIPYDLELEVVTARGNRFWAREVCRANVRKGRLVSLIGVLQDITERRRLADFLANVADQERARIGADLHDGLGQELTGLSLLLQGLATRSRREAPTLSEDLRNLSQLASSSVASVRDLAHGMLPLALREGDFNKVLRELARTTKRSFGVPVRTRFGGGKAYPPTGRVAEHLFRIAQEAITNAIKHGKARHISISVHASATKIAFSVSDDGIGFDESRVSAGMGLRIMRYRARMLGGLVDIQRARSGGTRILCVVPQ
jgi:signal transduction histidine kinase